MRILTICPSIRPLLLEQMSESFYDTAEEKNDLVTSNKGTVTEALNSFMPRIKEYDFIHITNDDVIYKTRGWDSALIKALGGKPGIAYGNDLFQGQGLPTFPFISHELCEAVGWIQYPHLIRYYGDTVWSVIGQSLKCLTYVPDVIIEHKTWFNGKGQDPPNQDVYMKDTLIFHDWLKTKAPHDVQIIAESIGLYDRR